MSEAEFDQMAMVHRLPRATVVDRIAFLTQLVVGQRVAHVGFADAGCREMQAGAGTWLHAHLATTAASLVGLDVDRAGVEAAQAAGYEAYLVDGRDPGAVGALGIEPADIVVAGEVIEHLDAPGPFLHGLHALVRPRGRLALTTPNASGLGNALAAIAGYEVNHPDHVTLFSWRTLTNLLDRHGWSPEEAHTYLPAIKPSTAAPTARLRALRAGGSALLALERTLGWLGAPFAADGLIVIAGSSC